MLLVGLVVGMDITIWAVQELFAKVVPASVTDSRFWAFIDAVALAILAAPGIVLAALVYAWRHGERDQHTRCGKCGYLLKGLTEPRCPECGERI